MHPGGGGTPLYGVVRPNCLNGVSISSLFVLNRESLGRAYTLSYENVTKTKFLSFPFLLALISVSSALMPVLNREGKSKDFCLEQG